MASNSTLQSVHQLLGSRGGTLAALSKQGRQRHDLTERIRLLLPAELHAHILGIGLQQQTLVLYTDTPAWATSLRYHTGKLLNLLKNEQDLCHIQKVRIKTQVALQQTNRKGSRRHSSRASAALLANLAATMNDAEIRRSLQRLSQRLAGTDSEPAG